MNRKWFTLVELVVVITIITILSAVSFISYTSYLTTARNSQRTVDLAQLSSALELFYKENKMFLNKVFLITIFLFEML